MAGSHDMLVYHAYKRTLNGMPQLQVHRIVWENGWPSLPT
jgi:hypothetical protein